MFMRSFSRLGMVVVMAGLAGSAAWAATDVIVLSDEAKVLSVAGEPATVVVGNPSMVDVTVQGNQILLHGRLFGSTNLIVLDRQGNQLAALDVTVMMGGNENVSVYKAGGRFSYVCAPGCQSALEVGDHPAYFDVISKESTDKIGLAAGASKDSQ